MYLQQEQAYKDTQKNLFCIFVAGGGGSFKSTSTSTKRVNGKTVTTKKVSENGNETVEVYEDNVLVSKTVNGTPQLTNGGDGGGKRYKIKDSKY